MPTAAAKPCRYPGCGVLVHGGGSWCEKHVRADPGSFADPERGSRHARGYGSKWDRLRRLILARDKGLCQQCRREGRLTPVGDKPFSAYVDHIIPKAEGGTDDDENLQTLCRPCHRAKTDTEKNRGRGG